MTPKTPDPDTRSVGNTPDDAGNESTIEKVKEEARDVKRKAGAKVRDGAEAGQHQAAYVADALSEAIDAAASNLDDQDREGLAHYTRDLSSKLANAAGQLEERSIDELAKDAKRLARNNPSLFMLGSIAVGFGLSRFFKASAEREHHDDHNAHRNASTSLDKGVSTEMPLQQRERDTIETYAASTAPRSDERRELL